MEKEIEGFTFFRSYFNAVSELSDEIKFEVLLAIVEYGLNGSKPTLSNPTSRAIFSIAMPSLDTSRGNVLNGKRGGRPKKPPFPEKKNPPFEKSKSTKTIDKDLDKDKDFVVGADKPPQKSTRFIPPSVDAVRAYCAERKNGIDPEKFVDFYEARGWMAGKSKMKDWRAAVRTWERMDEHGKSSDSGMGPGETGCRWDGYDLGGIKLD